MIRKNFCFFSIAAAALYASQTQAIKLQFEGTEVPSQTDLEHGDADWQNFAQGTSDSERAFLTRRQMNAQSASP